MKDQVLNNRDYAASDIPPYETDALSESAIYDRWESGTGIIMIRRVTITNGVVKREIAKDTWANRATATYSPIHD